jgi:hypothetical protein
MIPLILVAVAVAAVGITFDICINARDRKAAVEDGVSPLHNEICGARIGLTNWSMPFVRLTLYPMFALLSYAKKVILPYDTIDSVTVERGILGRGIRIRHHQPDAPERLIVWSADVDRLSKKLSSVLDARSGGVDPQ